MNILTSNKKHFMKNVKECRDVILKSIGTRLGHSYYTLHTCWTYDTTSLSSTTLLVCVRNNLTCYSTSAAVLSTLHTVSDNDVGCHRSNMCVMCSTSVPTLFQYF